MKSVQRYLSFLPALLLVVLVFVPALSTAIDDSFLIAFGGRVLIYAIAACALNIALGFGGMVSLGHALFIGIGMYSVALPVHYGIDSGWVHLAVCVLVCALIGSVTGLISLRTSGIAFIMITLAFAQMGYFVIVSLKQYGGDDGLGVTQASKFFGWTLGSPEAIFYCAWGLLLALTYWVVRLRKSPFGMVLRGGRQNARRINSIGLPLQRYQLIAYVLSAIPCGIAGMLLANLNAYASPSSMSWIISGDLIVMVVMGGMGTVAGPVIGALAFLGLEEVIKAYTEHWMAIFGIVILVMAMFGKRGIVGWMSAMTNRLSGTLDAGGRAT